MPNYVGLRRDPNRARIVAGLTRLRKQLDAEVGVRSMDKTMRLASWNIREFDSATYGLRTNDAYYYIAEIISRFDLVAVQEVRRDLKALEELMHHLGPNWQYLVTDTTEGKRGNNERLAFLFDTRKIRFQGVAGELVLPNIKSAKGVSVPAEQVARTPFTATFQAAWLKFQLATVHILYGEDVAESEPRIAEIRAVAQLLADLALDEEATSPNLVLLGDFNIFNRESAALTALTDAGWTIPPQLQTLPGTNLAKDKYYDQIAVLSRENSFHPAGPAGVFDFYKSVFGPDDRASYEKDMGKAYKTNSKGKARDDKAQRTYYRAWRTYQMSDHLPMWMDIQIDYSSEYIAGLAPPPAPSNARGVM